MFSDNIYIYIYIYPAMQKVQVHNSVLDLNFKWKMPAQRGMARASLSLATAATQSLLDCAFVWRCLLALRLCAGAAAEVRLTLMPILVGPTPMSVNRAKQTLAAGPRASRPPGRGGDAERASTAAPPQVAETRPKDKEGHKLLLPLEARGRGAADPMGNRA